MSTPGSLDYRLFAEHDLIQIDYGQVSVMGKLELRENNLPIPIKVQALVRSQHLVDLDLLLLNLVLLVQLVKSSLRYDFIGKLVRKLEHSLLHSEASLQFQSLVCSQKLDMLLVQLPLKLDPNLLIELEPIKLRYLPRLAPMVGNSMLTDVIDSVVRQA